MNASPGKLVTGLGGLLAVACFFLPWAEATVVQGLRLIIDPIVSILRTQLGEIVDVVPALSATSGRTLAFDLSFVSTAFKLLVLLPAVLGVLSIVNLFVSEALGPELAQTAKWAQLGLSVLAIALLVYNIPNVERLGKGSDIWMSLLTAAFGFRPALGLWGTLLGLVLIGAGAGLELNEAPAPRSRRRR